MKTQSEELLCLKHWKARETYWWICPIHFFSGKITKMAHFIFKLNNWVSSAHSFYRQVLKMSDSNSYKSMWGFCWYTFEIVTECTHYKISIIWSVSFFVVPSAWFWHGLLNSYSLKSYLYQKTELSSIILCISKWGMFTSHPAVTSC